MAETEQAESKRVKRPKHVFIDVDGQTLGLGKEYKKVYKDTLKHHCGVTVGEKVTYTYLELSDPLQGIPLACGKDAPICHACGLFEHEGRNPFMEFSGASAPLVTFVFDSISTKEDKENMLACDGPAGLLKKWCAAAAEKTNVSVDEIRFVSLTRCANRLNKQVNYKTKGQHCRIFFLQDLYAHPPKMIIPVGSAALGLLSHKSNAQDWGGRVLTWRGWPDDWLTDPEYVKPKTITVGKEKTPITVTGHPLLGPPPGPERYCLLYPIQSSKIIYSYQNQIVTDRWKNQIIRGLQMAKQGVAPLQYILPHYRILLNVDEVKDALSELIAHPGTLVAYDTETEGLHPFMGEKVVFMMFRYTHHETGEPVAFGFPWDYAEDPERGPASPLLPYLEELKPFVELALTDSVLVGHNTSFDALFTFKGLSKSGDHVPLDDYGQVRADWRAAQHRLNCLADAFKYDTWHMAYTRSQVRGSLGLEVIAYDFAPSMAGYEEDFTMLIELERDKMHPENGGHYARCPADKWDTHLKPYVLGDVETCYIARESLQAKLDDSILYRFPIAHPTKRGLFRYFQPPDRGWLYENIMSPAARMLTKVMGRGMMIDQKALAELEDLMPKAILESVEAMKKVGNGVVTDYINRKTATDEEKDNPDLTKRWEFDLEKKDQLREVLFDLLKLDVQRLTKTGRKIYSENADEWTDKITAEVRGEHPTYGQDEMAKAVHERMLKFAALDKFTLNKLAVDHEEVRPLQDYRKIHKLYSTYVRPLRNMRFIGIDKKARSQVQHLCDDGCIHAQFMLTGTRGGRLSCRNPNLQQLPKEGVKHGPVDLQVKKMYTSRFGKEGCLYGADFSQIELRLLAAMSGDYSMVNAYFKDVDLHTLTASRIFRLPYDTFSKDYRRELENSGRTKEAKELALKRDIAKCVDPATLISVNGSIMRIGSVHEGRSEDTFYPLTGLSVQGPYGSVPIKNFYSNGVKARYLICSRRGLVACSAEHPFLLGSGLLKKAKDIVKGDILVPPVRLESGSQEAGIAFCPFGVEARSQHFKIHIDENFAYLLGMFYGDGISNVGEVSICTGGTPEFFAWQDIIADSVKKAGFEPFIVRTEWSSDRDGPKIVKSGPTAGQAINGAYGCVNFGCTRVSDVFVQLGAVDNSVKRRRTLKIPTWLFNAERDVKMAFIAGWLDTDGSCARQGSLSGLTKSWVLAQDLMVLMDTCGVDYAFEPSWNKTYKRFYYRINLSVYSSFTHFLGRLRHPEKKRRLHRPKFKYENQRPNVVLQSILLEPSHLVDVEVDTPDHLFICNSSTCRNTCNFLTGYGGGAFGLQTVLANKQIYRPIEECERTIAIFFDSYPAVKDLLRYYKRFIEDSEVAVSVFGRVRVFEEVKSGDPEAKSKAVRAGCNHLIQSTASDMMLICLCVIEQMMRDEGLDSILVSTVHDSLVVDTLRKHELVKVHEIVDMVLNNMPEVFKMMFGDDYDASWMIVPFAGDGELGLNYGSMRSLPKVNTSAIDFDKILDDHSS